VSLSFVLLVDLQDSSKECAEILGVLRPADRRRCDHEQGLSDLDCASATIGEVLQMAYRTPNARALDLLRVLPLLGVLASFVAGPGCAGHAPYPKTWPPLRAAAGRTCEPLAGRYWNQGEPGRVYFTEMFFNVFATTGKETVTLSFPLPDQLDVAVVSPDRAPWRRSLSRKADQFKCDGSTLVIKPSPTVWSHGLAGPGVPGFGGSSVVLKVDLVEGCLIVTQRDKDFMWLPVPGWSTWSSWYRFCAVPSDGAPASGR